MSREHVNNIELIGRLGQTPRLRSTKEGVLYLPLPLATSTSSTDGTDQVHVRTTWHNATAWDQTAETVAALDLKNGADISLIGSMLIVAREIGGARHYVADIDVSAAKLNADHVPSRNTARIVGTVEGPPEIEHIDDHHSLTVLSVATKTISSGREREDAHSVILCGRAAAAARTMKAGDLVAINGFLQHRSVLRAQRHLSSVVAQRFQILKRATRTPA